MDKMRMESLDLTNENIEKIGELFPNVITESRDENGKLKKAINFDMLKQILSDDILEGDEAYEFTWVGKKTAMAESGKPVRKTLRPYKEESKDWDTTENLYIEGDNLDVLKLLQESYLGKVKLIYIDPPYNTGKDSFVYPDKFSMDKDEYEEQIGLYDDGDNKLFKENNLSNPRFHSDWCSMIYPRLQLARNLLSDDGVIFISIDDNEVANIKNICNEIFSESNFIAQISIASNSSKNNSKFVSITHEYVVCYAKAINCLPINWRVKRNNLDEFKKRASALLKGNLTLHEIHNELLALVKYPRFYEFDHYTYIDKRGPFRASDLTAPGSKNFYEVLHPITKKLCKTGTRGWAYTRENLQELINDDRILFGENETVIPQLKNYLFENENVLPKSIVFFDSQSSTKWMKSNKFGFDFPKATDFIQYLVSMYPLNNMIILDFFSGSATTAHAVMQLNAEDGGKRKFIMVQLDEKTNEKSESFRAGYKNICEIGKERIRRAGEKIKEEAGLSAQNLDIGFRVFKLDSTNMKDVYYSAFEYDQAMLDDLTSNIKEDRTEHDLLFGCLLEWGLPLSMPYTSEQISGVTIHTYNDGDLIACFAEKVPENVVNEIAKRQPLRAVFRDSSFASSPEKINVEEIFKLNAPNTSIKVL